MVSFVVIHDDVVLGYIMTNFASSIDPCTEANVKLKNCKTNNRAAGNLLGGARLTCGVQPWTRLYTPEA